MDTGSLHFPFCHASTQLEPGITHCEIRMGRGPSLFHSSTFHFCQADFASVTRTIGLASVLHRRFARCLSQPMRLSKPGLSSKRPGILTNRSNPSRTAKPTTDDRRGGHALAPSMFYSKVSRQKQESCWCSCRYLELSPTSFQNAFSMIGQTRRAECRTRTNPAIQIPSSMA